jgi:PAS domain S-box-containing protein
VLSIAGLPDGSHLVGTYDDGLVHLDGERQTRYTVDDGLPSGIVNAILPTGESGAAWVATDGGVVEWRSGRILPAPHPDVANAVALEMTPGPDGELWFALRTGGALIWRGNEVHALSAAEGLTDQIVWAVRRDRSGRMWLGSNGDGAFVVEHGAITRLGQTEGLANPFVWQILPDERGDVWMYTNQGLDRYRDGAFRHYGRADGLFEPEGNTTAALESSDGTLWFGTVTGLYRYTAADERPNLVAPPIVIEEVHVEDVGRLAPGAEVPPRPGMVAVRLAALSFRDEASVRYRYRLIGLDDRWSPPISRPELSWTGLPPGRYRLEVVGVNDSGVASRTAAAFPFRILPAFWQTWRFRIALGLLFAGAVGAVPLARARHLDRERRRLERVVAARTEALRESEARVRDILEHSTNLFYSRAPSGEITYLSPQSERYLRCAQDERLTWDDVVSDDRHSRAASALACTLVAGGLAPSPYELELARRDGGRTWVEVNEAPLIRDGKVVSVVGAFTDITERKRGEMERALLEEQLRQSQKMEAIGRLAGGIAHDFNNLLTSVMGHAALATETLGRDHEVAADLEEVRIASERAAKLVAQLLAFGRRQIIQPTVLDLNAGVTEATRMLERLLGEDLRLDCVLDERTPPVRMDPGQLDQILVNLALNARENMPTGGTLTISTAPGALSRALDEGVVEGPCAMLRVRDTGHGMDEATRARVFEPFFTTKAVGEGSGLGLATVYGIVKQNHGHISVESAPGAGATFDVLIPAASTGAATDTSARRRAVASPAGAGDSETVLLVEDQDDVRAVLATTLERAGFRVLAASDGASAYATAIAERGRIAILVTDMVMPGMSGKEVAERVTAVHPETGVLFVSGYTDEALGMRGVLVPETEWLQKPFAPGTLVERVRGILPGEGKGPTVN